MRWIKYILLLMGVLVGLCLLLIAIVFITFDNDDYRRLAIRSVKFYTGNAITIEGPFSIALSSNPYLSAEVIRFHPEPGKPPPPVTTIGKLQFQIALWPLVTGTLVFRELLAEDVIMAVIIGEKVKSEDQRTFSLKTLSEINIPILENVRLGNIRLDIIDKAADRTVDIRLRKFHIDDVRDSGPLFVNGEGSISGNEFKINGQLGALAALFKGAEPYPLMLTFSSSGFNIMASGTVEDLLDGEGLAFRLSGETDELSNLYKLMKIDVPQLGALNFHTTVTGDISAPKVSDLSVTLSGSSLLEFAVKGTIDNAISGEGTSIQFAGSCANPQIFTWLLPEDLPELKQIHITGEVREKNGALAMEKLEIEAETVQGLSAGAHGRIDLGAIIRAPEIQGMDIGIMMSMPTTNILRPYVIDSLPEMGPLTAQGRLTGTLKHLSLEDVRLESGGSGPLRVTSWGRIGRLPEVFGAYKTISQIDLNINLQSVNTRSLTSDFGLNMPELGAVSVNTRIRGSSDRFQLTEIDARTTTNHGLKVALSGQVEFDMSSQSGLLGSPDIQAHVDAPSVRAALGPLGITNLPDLKPLRINARIGGSIEAISLNGMSFSIGQSGPVRMELTGDIGRIPLVDNRPASGVKLQTLLSADNTAALTEVLGISIPDFGPLKASAQISDRNGTYGMRRLNLVVGDKKKPVLKVTGRIASVLHAYDVFVDGIDLTAEARDFYLRPLSDLLGRRVPNLGPLNGRFQIAGNPTDLAVSKAKLTTVSPQGLTITATGDIRRIRMAEEKPLAGVDLSLSAAAPGLVALPGLEGLDLPDLGPLQMKATVNDRSGSFDVEAFEIRSGPKRQALLHLQGQILRVENLKQMALEATVEAASQPWVIKYLQQPEAVNYPMTGVIRVTGDTGGMRIDEIRLGMIDDEGVAIKAWGRLSHLFESPAVELDMDITAPDPPIIGSMLGVSLPPLGSLAINGRLNGNAQKVEFFGKTRFGDTVFQSTVGAAFAGPRPRIDARFAATSVNLEDIGIFPAAPPAQADSASKAQSQEDDQIFDDTPLFFDALNNFDAHITLDAGKLVGQDIAIENLDIDIQIEKGRMRIYPAKMTYAAGFTEFDFIIDASGQTPVFDLNILGENIDIEDLLASAHEPLVLSGELNLAVDLLSRGRTAREIASNLDGEFSLSLENGQIHRIINFLSADAFNLMLTTADRRQSTDLNCLVSKIQFLNGVGDIEYFSMDTSRIRAKAAGNVNLAAETIDVVINPRQKRRLFRRTGSTVRINGLLAQPSARVFPLSEAVELYGTLLMPYIFLPERLLGNLWYLIRSDNSASPCLLEFR